MRDKGSMGPDSGFGGRLRRIQAGRAGCPIAGGFAVVRHAQRRPAAFDATQVQ